MGDTVSMGHPVYLRILNLLLLFKTLLYLNILMLYDYTKFVDYDMKDVEVEPSRWSHTHDDTIWTSMQYRGVGQREIAIMSRTNISRCGHHPVGEEIGERATEDGSAG